MRYGGSGALALLILMATGGCETEGVNGGLTELVVTVESDLDVPGELDAILISVEGGSAQDVDVDLTESPLPQSLSLVHFGGPLGPFHVEAVGTRDGEEVARASVDAFFEIDRSIQLTIHLTAGCTGPLCGNGGGGGDAGGNNGGRKDGGANNGGDMDAGGNGLDGGSGGDMDAGATSGDA